MALIKCRECGAQISSEANACPHCGIVITRKKKSTLGGYLLSLIIVATIIVLWMQSFESSTPRVATNIQTDDAQSTDAKPAWNETDVNADTNGNIAIAAGIMRHTAIDKPVYGPDIMNPGLLQRPWEYYGKVECYMVTGMDLMDSKVFPDGSNESKKVGGGEVAEMSIEDSSVPSIPADFYIIGSPQYQAADMLYICGMPVGRVYGRGNLVIVGIVVKAPPDTKSKADDNKSNDADVGTSAATQKAGAPESTPDPIDTSGNTGDPILNSMEAETRK